jgi:hypothetical protein
VNRRVRAGNAQGLHALDDAHGNVRDDGFVARLGAVIGRLSFVDVDLAAQLPARWHAVEKVCIMK